MQKVRSLAALGAASSLLTLGLVATGTPASAAPGSASPSCSAFDDPVYQVVKPKTGASLLTTSSVEAGKAVTGGFSDDRGAVFAASKKASTGLTPVHRLYRAAVGDFLVSASPGEWASAAAQHGYVDQGVTFYASRTPADCLVPVYRYVKGSKHRAVTAGADGTALAGAGWKSEGVAFYAGPSAGTPSQPGDPGGPSNPADPGGPTDPGGPVQPGETSFSFAVMPDTQQEVLRSNDRRFVNRTQWLASQKSALNLKFVGHTGDVVNWDTADHSQYVIASNAMKPLEQAGIPYALSIGNHDTQATGVGGGARDSKNTRKLQRDTSTFNSYFSSSRYTDVAGAYEPGKVDNIYTTYNAGGAKWMLLTLELWPRKAVVAWADQVVADHPDYNVIVQTHSYLDESGRISQESGYGDTSPQYLYDHLVSQYSNVKMVFSGHVGIAASRVDTGVHGNKILSFEQTFHSNTTNPVRLVTVDTKADTVKTWIYAPFNGESWSQYAETVSGMSWAR